MSEPEVMNGTWDQLRRLNPDAVWEPKNKNFCAEVLALLGLLRPEMSQVEIWIKLDDVLLYVKLPHGDEHYGDRVLKLVKAMSKAERLALRDRAAGVAEISASAPAIVEDADAATE